MKLYFGLFLIIIGADFLSEPVQRKIISDDEFNYVFYVSPENLKNHKIHKKYYWYKSGEIHSSIGGSSGDILHGKYTKTHINNTILEQGDFKKGLKDNEWKKWYRNGMLDEVSIWKNGLKNGTYLKFSQNGAVLTQGAFKENRKHGVWIENSNKDTIYFEKGLEIKKPKSFFKKIFSKKEKDDSDKKVAPDGKKSFFKRLFSKKEKNTSKKKKKEKRSNKSNSNKKT